VYFTEFKPDLQQSNSKPASSSLSVTIDDEPLLVTQGDEITSDDPLSQGKVATEDDSLSPGQDVMSDISLSLGKVTKENSPPGKEAADENFLPEKEETNNSGKQVTDNNSPSGKVVIDCNSHLVKEVTDDNSLSLGEKVMNDDFMHEDVEEAALTPATKRKRKMTTLGTPTKRRQTRTNSEYVREWSKNLNSCNPLD